MAIQIQNTKHVLAIAPQTLAAATATEIEVNATGWHNALFIFSVGAAAATSNISVAKVQSAPTTGGAQTDITGAALASGDIDADTDNTVHAIEVDLTDKSIGQFLSVVLTGSVAANIEIGVTCVLSRGEVSPTTAAEAGFTTLARA